MELNFIIINNLIPKGLLALALLFLLKSELRTCTAVRVRKTMDGAYKFCFGDECKKWDRWFGVKL
jgi:hypothetical protein